MYEIFEKLMKENNVTAYKVSKETGIATSTLTDWKKQRSTPKQDKLQKIADYFNVSIDYLTGKSKYKNFAEEFDAKIDTQQLSKNAILYDVINIPIVGSVRAGEPILATENITGYHPVLKSNLCKDKDYFYLRVQGDSMNQEFNEGSLLLIEKCDDAENGSIAVILIDGMEATVKKIVKNENMITLIPMSTNPIYVPHMYDLTKDEIRIIGRVKEATKIY